MPPSKNPITVKGVARLSSIPHVFGVETYGKVGSWDNRKNAVREMKRNLPYSRTQIVDCTITIVTPKKGKK